MSTYAGRRPVHEVHDHLARGRRLDVELADRRRGIHDDDRKPAPGPRLRHALGVELALLVVADHLGAGHRSRLVGRRPVGRQPERADRARVDDPRDASRGGRLQHVVRAVDVRAVQLPRIAGPEAVVGGAVVERRDPGDRPRERGGIRDVAFRDLDGQAFEVLAAALRTDQAADRAAAGEQGADHVRPDEARAAGDEIHRTIVTEDRGLRTD